MQRLSLLQADWQLGHRWRVSEAKFLVAPSKGTIGSNAEDGNRKLLCGFLCGLHGTESFSEMNPGNWNNLASPLPLLTQLSLPLASCNAGEILLLPFWAPHPALQSTNGLTHHLRGGPPGRTPLGIQEQKG